MSNLFFSLEQLANLHQTLYGPVLTQIPAAEWFHWFNSNLFTVPKLKGDIHLILNLKVLNVYNRAQQFSMESAIAVLYQGASWLWM